MKSPAEASNSVTPSSAGLSTRLASPRQQDQVLEAGCEFFRQFAHVSVSGSRRVTGSTKRSMFEEASLSTSFLRPPPGRPYSAPLQGHLGLRRVRLDSPDNRPRSPGLDVSLAATSREETALAFRTAFVSFSLSHRAAHHRRSSSHLAAWDWTVAPGAQQSSGSTRGENKT